MKNNANILFLNLDAGNYVRSAISHAQRLTMNSPELEGELNITAIVKNLEQALLRTQQASLNIHDVMNEQAHNEKKEKGNIQSDLDRIFNLSEYMVCIASPEGYFLRISPAFTETLGFSENELLAKPFAEFIHQDDKEMTMDNMEPISKGVQIVRCQNRYICKDGSLKWLEWTSRSFEKGGNLYAMAYDITDHKRAEEELSNLIKLQESIGMQFLKDHSNLNGNISFLTKITNNVLANLNNSNFDVNTLAKNVFMSRSTLQRKIKKESGVSAAYFIRQARLAKAHDLIKKKANNTLSETAYAVGFKHTGHFSKLYKKYVIEIKNGDVLSS
jgi:PAS domain S-box-containing protein